MDVQLYLYVNGTWKEYNPKPASHTHGISDITELQNTLNGKANGNEVVRATTENKNILGTTAEVFNISEKKVWFNKGALFYGTAQNAGLVTRGVSGVKTDGSAKDHLYINYDGNNTLSRQLVLGAGSIGTSRGHGIYDYSAVRGDAFIAYLNNTLGSYEKTITGAASTIASTNLLGDRALISNSTGKVAVSAVTSTELGYLDGVTSSIQTQLSDKVDKAGGTVTGATHFTDKITTDLIQGSSEKVSIDLGDVQDYPNIKISSTGTGQMEIYGFTYLQLHTLLNMNDNRITGLATPTSVSDAVNKSYLDTQLATKVDTDGSKVLSTNDYTTAEKNKLSGIQTGAEVNVQANWTETSSSSDAFIRNKPTTFNPSSHTHEISEITDLQFTLDKKIEQQDALYVSGNCNNITTTSIYQGSWSSNRPTGANSYGTLITTHTTHGSSNYLRQIYLSEGSTKMYTRVKSSTWQAWEQIGTMSLSGSTLNITL